MTTATAQAAIATSERCSKATEIAGCRPSWRVSRPDYRAILAAARRVRAGRRVSQSAIHQTDFDHIQQMNLIFSTKRRELHYHERFQCEQLVRFVLAR